MSNSPRLSCALCTFNGERYIESQLLSILQQQLPLDEIVICDDGSTDRTLALIEKLRKDFSMEIRVERNVKSLGVCANFKKAIELCTGDIIFLSDQDDWWMPEKSKFIVDWFRENPDKEVVFTDGKLMDDDGREISGKSLFSVLSFPASTRKTFDQGFDIEAFLKHNRAVGATMAFRKSFVPFMTINTEATTANGLPLHDYAITLSAAGRHQLGYIAVPLISYRIHLGQSCGFGEWLNHPPHQKNLVKPVLADVHLLEHLPAETRPRVLFGARRRELARGWRKPFLYFYWNEYKKAYGPLAIRPFLYDLFLF